ncbi:hypothetical protein [Aquidulcibacter sp.]|uniref:hypothetical protein n=1 Tax=Aquidulcibacter sp. TaxID=2052990 RepID=UPI003BA4A5FB
MSNHQINPNAVTVIGLTRVLDPKPNKGGNSIIAYFDAEARGFILCGCAFVRTPANGLTVFMPKLSDEAKERRSVKLVDDQLRTAFVRAAQAAYRAMGGTDGEWIPLERNSGDAEGISRLLNRSGSKEPAS